MADTLPSATRTVVPSRIGNDPTGGASLLSASNTPVTRTDVANPIGGARLQSSTRKFSPLRFGGTITGSNFTALNYQQGTSTLVVTSPTGTDYSVNVAAASPTQVTVPVVTVYTKNFFVALDSLLSVKTVAGYKLVSELQPGDALTTLVSRTASSGFVPLNGVSVTFTLAPTEVNYQIVSLVPSASGSALVVNGVVTGAPFEASDTNVYNIQALQADYLGGSISDVLEVVNQGTYTAGTPLRLNQLPVNATLAGNPVVAYNEATGDAVSEASPIDLSRANAVVTTSEALFAGALVNVYRVGADSFVRLARGDAFDREASGYVLAAYGANAEARVYFDGNNSAAVGMSPGPQWLSTTDPGKTSSVAPTTLGIIVQPVGIATSSTNLVFQRGDVLEIPT